MYIYIYMYVICMIIATDWRQRGGVRRGRSRHRLQRASGVQRSQLGDQVSRNWEATGDESCAELQAAYSLAVTNNSVHIYLRQLIMHLSRLIPEDTTLLHGQIIKSY